MPNPTKTMSSLTRASGIFEKKFFIARYFLLGDRERKRRTWRDSPSRPPRYSWAKMGEFYRESRKVSMKISRSG
jgi:hypothetical protein